MRTQNPNQRKQKFPLIFCLLGLLGILNFILGFWVLAHSGNKFQVYFWFAKLYGYIIFPSLILFPISIVVVFLWFSRQTNRMWLQYLVISLGIILSVLCFIPALGSTLFISTLRVLDNVKQNNHVYYLVSYQEDMASDYAFCESDSIGFFGVCSYIGWSGGTEDPIIYIDENTNLVTVESKNPAFIWINSDPPKCISNMEETNEDGLGGGCSP